MRGHWEYLETLVEKLVTDTGPIQITSFLWLTIVETFRKHLLDVMKIILVGRLGLDFILGSSAL